MTAIKFVILSDQRSGSVYLERALDGHPDIRCHGEVLLGLAGPNAVESPQCLERHRTLRLSYSWILSGAAFLPAATLRRAFRSREGARAVGVRVMHAHMRRSVQRLLQEDPSILIVQLRRRNLLRQYVSRVQMHQRQAQVGKGSAHTEQQTRSVTHVHIDPEKAYDEMAAVELRAAMYWKRLSNRVSLELWYEDIFEAAGLKEDVQRKLCTTLGVKQVTLSAPLVRTGTQNLQDSIVNWDEVATFFAKTQWAWMLDA